ncbi:MAG: metallophosphoesterase [Pelobacteraceae bacterium]
MATVFVHLSDLHVSHVYANPLFERTEAIAGLLRSMVAPDDHCVIIITGDIANWGKVEEYVLAAEFIEKLQKEVAEHCINQVEILIVPGNHDLDFATEGCEEKVRDLIIDQITPTAPPADEIVKFCSLPFANYNNFIKTVDATSVNDLMESINLNIPKAPVRVHLINTSRFSKKVDLPGKSWIPSDILEKQLVIESDGMINISIMHHPYSWNRADIASSIKQILEKNCDVVFTGHVHEPDAYSKRRSFDQNLFVEGGVLQDHKDHSQSSFNIVRLGQDNETFTCTVIEWNGVEYEPKTEPYEHRYLRLRRPLLNSFDLREDWGNWLEQVGTDFRHTRKPDLKMSDIFVYPDLQRLDVRKSCSATGIIRSNCISGFIQEKKRVLIGGVEKSGKTSLAKQLFRDLREGGLVPLLIRSDFQIPSGKRQEESLRVQSAFNTALEKVYIPVSCNRFWQTKTKERVLIIDDYGRINLPSGARDALLRWADMNFGIIVVLSSPGVRLREVLNRSEDDSMLWAFEHADILESDAESRYELIEKWVAAGQDPFQTTKDDIFKITFRRCQTIDSVINQGLIPSLPMFLLMMMQQLDGQGSIDANSGLYGSLYEGVIRDVIKEGTSSPAEIEVFINYLTEFAFYVFSERKKNDDATYSEWHTQYCNTYNRSLNPAEVLAHLEAVGVYRRQNGTVCFKYKYYYWFFVAKYLANNIQETSCFEVIRSLTSQLYMDDAANIMLFLCHFAKDRRILDMILCKVKEHFPDVTGFDLSKSPKVIPAGATHLAQLLLTTSSCKEAHVESLREHDDLIRPNGLEEFDDSDDETEIQNTVTLLNEINSAAHLIKICGQILRNFYGGIKGDIQVNIIKECYDLSLRMMAVLFNHMELDKDQLAETVAKILIQRNPMLSGIALDDDVKRSIRTLSLQISYGFIKHVSNSLGLADLERSFDDVLKCKHNTISYELLDISTRLDFFDNFPEGKILSVAEQMERHVLGFEVLRILAWEHFKLFKHDFRLTQRICTKLDIKSNAPAIVGFKDKKNS